MVQYWSTTLLVVYWWSPSGHPSYHLDETDNEEKVGGALNDDECLDAHEGIRIICEIKYQDQWHISQ